MKPPQLLDRRRVRPLDVAERPVRLRDIVEEPDLVGGEVPAPMVSFVRPRRGRGVTPPELSTSRHAVSPQLVSTEYPRPSRGVAAARFHGIIHVPAAASPQLVSTELSTSRPRRRRDSLERKYLRGERTCRRGDIAACPSPRADAVPTCLGATRSRGRPVGITLRACALYRPAARVSGASRSRLSAWPAVVRFATTAPGSSSLSRRRRARLAATPRAPRGSFAGAARRRRRANVSKTTPSSSNVLRQSAAASSAGASVRTTSCLRAATRSRAPF